MRIERRFTKQGQDALMCVDYEKRTSRISNPDGSVVFEMNNAEIPRQWTQLATDIMVSKYFRKAGVPQVDKGGEPVRDADGKVVTGPETSVKQVVHRLAGCWRNWAETHGYFDTAEDAQAFYDELAYMMLHQMCAPNSPQWFNTGLNFAYGITGPAQGHFYCDPKTGELLKSADAYSHPQPHACFIQSVADDLVNPGGIMDLWTREARLFKYGSGTGSNFSRLRGENESLSGGGKSSGLMSFLKIGDRAAGAIKSGGTTRRAAKMVCLDLDHPDIESFVNWKVREELKVASMVEGFKLLPKSQQDVAKKLGLKLDYDFNGEAYFTVSGQNSNNSVRIPNAFFKALETDGDWTLIRRIDGKPSKTLKARDLWEQIAYAAWRCADPGVQYDDTINQWHTCPKSGRINASNPCVTGDTRVLTPGGIWRRIDQMIHLPARVVTNLDGQEIHVTDGAFPTGTRDVYELTTAGGYSVKVTGDHKIFSRQRGWVAASELTTADEVRLPGKPACVTEVGEPQDPRFFQLLGLFVSQANGVGDTLRLVACLPTPQVEQFVEYVSENWGERAYSDDYVERGDVVTATLSDRRLISRLRAFVRSERGMARLSDEAFTAGLAAQRHLLKGLFTADGRVIDGTIELTSRSYGLLADVQMLLLGFGIRSIRNQDLQYNTGGGAAGDGAIRPVGGALPDRPDPRVGGFSAGDANYPRHGLRIEPGSLRLFARLIGLLPGEGLQELAAAVASAPVRANPEPNYDCVSTFVPIGRQQVFDLTEPVTHSFIANGITVHNCSEYMFLDDTACNLASLNVLTFYDSETGQFDVERYRHGIRLWTIVLETSVLMASFPSEEIAQLSYRFRTLGLGYANLGAMLMQAGIPYDSQKGRAVCAALTSILTGESYATSAEMAGELGAFPEFQTNRDDMLRVIRNHRRAAYDIGADRSGRDSLGGYEQLDISPVGIDASQFRPDEPLVSSNLLRTARECWDRALSLGERHGYRNAQTTVIAPTGTIGLLMDCDTTGVEPDFALVKFKKLAGGGYFKIANQSLRPSLVAMKYTPQQINDIMRHVMGTLTLDNVPHINTDSLMGLGLTADEIAGIENALPEVFELGFAFTPWNLSPETFRRLNILESEWKAPSFNLLRRLGFSSKQIGEANDVVCGRGTIEGAPHIRPEHLPVFDCANRCGKHGKRFIEVEGHIRMMAAAQPFISGAISKTINLPNEADIVAIKQAYQLSWQLGLKANALYRDGSKLSQPLNVKSDAELDSVEEDDQENVESARQEVAGDVASGVKAATAAMAGALSSDNLSPVGPVHTNIIEKIVERVVERPLRRRLPDTRHALNHKFDVGGHEGYINVGLYEDGTPGEVFITMAKEGSTIGGLMDTIATLISLALQYGVPIDSLVRKFEHMRFEPSGMTRNTEIPFAKSLIDYIFRWLAMEFVVGYRAANAPNREKPTKTVRVEPQSSDAADSDGNGSGILRNNETVQKGFDYGSGLEQQVSDAARQPQSLGRSGDAGVNLRLKIVTDPISQQGSEMQADAPACDVCGSITVRSGTCYKCLNCGNSMGCS